jgi:hypothetical protein
MSRLRKFLTLPRRERRYFYEAISLLLLSTLCVKTIAFKHIYDFLRARRNNGSQGALDRADEIRLVSLSLSRAAALLPWESLCLSRSIAAFIMLRRRGIPAVLVAGVKISEDSLCAHAWIRTDGGTADGSSENSAYTPVISIGQEPLIANSAKNRLD